MESSPRTVKPHGIPKKRYTVVAVYGENVITEHGETFTTDDLIYHLFDYKPMAIITTGAADLLTRIDSVHRTPDNSRFQWRISQHERAIVRPNGDMIAARVSIAVHYVGWKGGYYHRLLDPVTLYGHRLDKIWPGDEPHLHRLLKLGIAIRDFCETNDIDIRPTIGAISGQLLTDRRFYPRARRKVPAVINERTREYLPGNHYDLLASAERGTEYTAHYLDQSNAHHYHAATAELPDANLLFAYGRFKTLDRIVFDTTPERFYGLYCLDLRLDRSRWNDRHCHWFKRLPTVMEKEFVFSNELPHLLDMGFEVIGIRAAWGSRYKDTGLGKYARWSMEQLQATGAPGWLKPLLLSAYGVLATKPRYAEAIFAMAKAGTDVRVRTGANHLTGKYIKHGRKLEPGIANVLHRGMIEAATRSESVGLAQWLDSLGHEILSIYADAVIVRAEGDKELPTLPQPWRNKRTLNHLQFITHQAFMSGEMTKLPGVTRELRGHVLRVRAPKMTVNVPEMMEREEAINALLTNTREP